MASESILIVLPLGCSSVDIAQSLVEREWTACATSAGSSVQVQTTWDPTTVDSSTPGLQRIEGQLQPDPAQAVLAPGFDGSIGHWVYFEGANEAPLELLSILSPLTDPVVLALGGDVSTVFDRFAPLKNIVCQVKEWDGRTLGVRYITSFDPPAFQLDDFDSTKRGIAPLYGTPKLPLGMVMPSSQPPLSVRIAVVDPDLIDLSSSFLSVDRLAITARWLRHIDSDLVQPQYRIGKDGPWINDVRNEWGSWQMVNFSNTMLSLQTHSLALKTDYYFRVEYKKSASDTQAFISDVLHVYLDNHDTVVDWTSGGGDNDGGDRDDNELPDLEQPPPSNGNGNDNDDDSSSGPVQPPPPSSSQASHAPRPVQPPTASSAAGSAVAPPPEIVTSTSTQLSGSRIKQLLEVNPNHLLFEKQGVALELPSAFVVGLNLTADDRLEVRIEQPDKSSIHLALRVNGNPIVSIPATRLSIPWSGEGKPQLFYLSDDTEVLATLQDGILTATIDKTGDYILRLAPQTPPPSSLEASLKPTGTQPASTLPTPNTAGNAVVKLLWLSLPVVIGLWYLVGRYRHGQK